MVVMLGHDVAPVLLGPSGRTVVPGGIHQLGTTRLDITHGAHRLMVVNVFLEGVEKTDLVLGAINIRRALVSCLVLCVLRCAG